MGCYGSTFYETPNLDSFAKQGMRFTDRSGLLSDPRQHYDRQISRPSAFDRFH
ncbi:MAG: hypothetical protein ACYTBJ_26530 [Planctomycetota bacterium]